MRRSSAHRTVCGLLIAACGQLALAPSAGAGSRDSPTARSASTHLQVTQSEYRLSLSHGSVPAGRVDLEEVNRGHEEHDLRLRLEPRGGEIRGHLLHPGARWDGVVYLKAGTYKLWCSLPEHAKLGMHTTLRVTR